MHTVLPSTGFKEDSLQHAEVWSLADPMSGRQAVSKSSSSTISCMLAGIRDLVFSSVNKLAIIASGCTTGMLPPL